MNKPTLAESEEERLDGWHGSLHLVYADRHGAIQLIHNQSLAPFLVQRSFYPEGAEVCHSVVLHTAGGVVGGANSEDFPDSRSESSGNSRIDSRSNSVSD